MIGDWVMLTDPIHNGEKVQVKAIPDDGHITVDGGIMPMFEPIPLTAEILGKNFSFSPYNGGGAIEQYYLLNDYYDVEISEYTDGLWEVVVDEVGMSCLPTWKMYVCHVHELQRALRLCGIEKEIEL